LLEILGMMARLVQPEQWEYLAQPELLALTALPEPPASLVYLVLRVQPGSTGQQVLLELLVFQERQAPPELRAVMAPQVQQVPSV
jgi:hypothetical protein